MSRVARPAVAASRSRVRARRLSGSRCAVGSSRISTAGSASRARARASRWRWPPDRAAPCAPACVSHPRGSDRIQSSSPARRGRVGELLVGGRRPGQAEVVAQRRVEDMRVLRAAADRGPYVVSRVAGQVVPVQGGGACAQVDETEQHAGHGGLARAVRADQGDAPSRRQVQVDAVERGRAARLIADLGAAQPHPDRAVGQPPRRGGLADGVGRVQYRRDPAGRFAGVAELDGGRGQGGDRLEGGQRGQRQHGQRDSGQRAAAGGGDAEQQDAP